MVWAMRVGRGAIQDDWFMPISLRVKQYLVIANAGVAEVEEDKRIRKKRKRVLAHWGTLLRVLSVKARLDAQYARDDND